jgi:hypothetical protein
MDVQMRKWTRVEYERLIEAEILGPDDRVELLGGAMICKERQYSPHATGIQLVQRALTEAFGAGWVVRPQMPVALDEVIRARTGRRRRTRRSARLLTRRAPDAARPRRGGRAFPSGFRSRPQGKSRYGTAMAFGPDDRVAPLAAPTATINVADLLP